ncbi:retinoblastoma binding protein [Perkinsus chesapeaki]|uniref:Retinoblastoma binding protein n=1 Tax=Perkinsus chesapeaki TaxID=330153 RepID=A0A7J6N2B6_PERCH|nr:retinoblastoma binding protein [Perkinsus chesapeaki]
MKAAEAVRAMPEEDMDVDGSDDNINEEFNIWKKNTPFLYDTVISHTMEWPSLTVEWLPSKTPADRSTDYTTHKMILGTHTSNGDQNYLMIGQVKVPQNAKEEVDVDKYIETSESGAALAANKDRMCITTKINHPGEVNRAKYCPQNPFIIATLTNTGDILLFDYSKHPSHPKKEGTVDSLCTLKGHTAEGYALAWSPSVPGRLVSGAYDSKVAVWDANAPNLSKGKTVSPLTVLSGHTDVVEAVSTHRRDGDILASSGDDGQLLVWDLRSPQEPAHSVAAVEGGGDCNCVQFSPHNDNILATAGSDKIVSLWDMRQLSRKIYTLERGHKEDILNIEWNPSTDHLIMSAGQDRRVTIWDLARVGEEIEDANEMDGPPEMVFVHGGHCSRVTDISWNQFEPTLVASTSEDNVVQVWKPNEGILYAEYDEDVETLSGGDEGMSDVE